MQKTFSVNVAAELRTLRLNNGCSGEISCTVTNGKTHPARARISVVPKDGAQEEWFHLPEHAEGDLSGGESQQFKVLVAIPQDIPAGTFSFRIDVCNVADSQEDFTEGDAVILEWTPREATPVARPWWLIPVAVAVPILVLTVVVYLLFRPDASVDVIKSKVFSRFPIAHLMPEDIAFWRPVTPTGYAIPGDQCIKIDDITSTRPTAESVLLSVTDEEQTKHPLDFKSVATFQQAPASETHDAYPTVTIWRPVPPPDFVVLGDVATVGTNKPPLNTVSCVHEDLVMAGKLNTVRLASLESQSGKIDVYAVDSVNDTEAFAPGTFYTVPTDADTENAEVWCLKQSAVNSGAAVTVPKVELAGSVEDLIIKYTTAYKAADWERVFECLSPRIAVRHAQHLVMQVAVGKPTIPLTAPYTYIDEQGAKIDGNRVAYSFDLRKLSQFANAETDAEAQKLMKELSGRESFIDDMKHAANQGESAMMNLATETFQSAPDRKMLFAGIIRYVVEKEYTRREFLQPGFRNVPKVYDWAERSGIEQVTPGSPYVTWKATAQHHESTVYFREIFGGWCVAPGPSN